MKKIALILLLLCSLTQLIWGEEDNYPNYSQLINKYDSLTNNNADLVNVLDIGNSQEQSQVIKAYKFTDNSSPEIDKINILLIGNLYAKDIVETNALYSWAEEMAQNHDTMPYSSYLNNFNIYIIPSLNPDGLDTVLETNNFILLTNDNSVNLNRNFASNWVHGDNEDQNNKGNYAYSEGETIALKYFLENHKIDFCFFNLTEELGQREINFPYNWAEVRQSPDYQALYSLTYKLADIAGENWSSSPNFEKNGNLLDELYLNYGVIPFAISYDQHYILPDPNEIQNNKQIFKLIVHQFFDMLIDYNENSPLETGMEIVQVIDSVSQEPIAAEIAIDGLDTTAFQNNKSNSLNGKFYRFVPEGTYYLIVRKKGYLTKYQQFTINNQQQNTTQIELQPLSPATINIEVFHDDQHLASTLIMQQEGFEDIISINGSISIETFEGQHEFTLITEGFAPIKRSIYIQAGNNNLHFEPGYTNHIFYEDFEGTCCLWIMNGPWLVVNDSTHNSYFIKDSYSDNGFYNVDADYTLVMSSPLSLIGYTGQDVYLHFEHSVYTEWDNDFVSVEVSYDDANWISIYKFAGNSFGWKHELISLNNFIENDLYLRFRLKDGIEGNANHIMLTDPGWKIDNIQITASVSSVANDDHVVIKPEQSKVSIYPNPFNPVLHVKYETPREVDTAEIKIFNVKG
ncbi:MAG: M14 family zinc carboxypeptidase, partial [Candidatus Cloacimonadales bacterium]|nr:M14 family zinc carboxypeptidase [Candidatus Cloacimonadales bacterium]